jgi:FkbM family methyltransferase
MKYKMMPAIEGVEKDFYWDENDTGLYGYYENINSNSGPVGDWFASHKGIIEKISKNGRNLAIQAGGAFGMYPILLRNYFQTVYTFEPNPVSYDLLCKNIWHHQIDNIIASDYALGEYDANVTVRPSPDPRNLGMTTISDEPGDIKMIRIDDMYDTNQKVDLIWLDIEGYEYKALLGAKKTIRIHEPVVGVERPTEWVYNFMNYMGYIPWKQSKMDVFFVK